MGGSSPAGNTTTTNTPWQGAIPYMQGGQGVAGTMPLANQLYGQSGWNPQMQTAANNWQSDISNVAIPISGNMMDTGYNMTNGSNNTNISPVSNHITAPLIDLTGTLNGMGAANPTQADAQLLSGQVSPTMTNAIGNEANSMYGQATQNLMQQVMPQLNEQAIGAGGYGGSRQGIAQGLALSNMQQNLAPSIAGMYTNANQTAQGLQGQTANNLTGIGGNIASQNAANSLAAQQANAQIAMQNNAQTINQSHNNSMNQLLGAQLGSQGYNQGMNALQTGMTLTQAPANYNWNNLKNYSGIVNGTGALGGAQTQPYFQNQTSNLASLGLMGALGYAALAA